MAPSRKSDGLGNSWAKAQPYVDAVWEFVAATGLGTAGGWWLDRRFHTTPWLLVAGSMIGFAAGMTVMFRTMLSLSAREMAEQRRKEAESKTKDVP